MERRLRIHPQVRQVYTEIYDDLRREGMSDAEAQRNLRIVFDWSLESLRQSIIRPREDEFAESEIVRERCAEKNIDICHLWLCLRLGGAGQDVLDLFCKECLNLDFNSALYWIIRMGFSEFLSLGQKINSVEQAHD